MIERRRYSCTCSFIGAKRKQEKYDCLEQGKHITLASSIFSEKPRKFEFEIQILLHIFKSSYFRIGLAFNLFYIHIYDFSYR